MSGFANSVRLTAAAASIAWALATAVSAHAEPPGTNTTEESTQQLYGLLSKGFLPEGCDTTDVVGSQLATIDCFINRDPAGPFSATYALYPDAQSVQSGFSTPSANDELAPCPGINQSPTVYHYRNFDELLPLYQWWLAEG